MLAFLINLVLSWGLLASATSRRVHVRRGFCPACGYDVIDLCAVKDI